MSIISPLAHGISLGAGLADVKRIEDSVRAGRNIVLTAITQTTQVHLSLSLVNQALDAGRLPQVPLAGHLIGYIAPSVIARIVKLGVASPCVRKCFIFLQDAIGLVCQVAAIVSAISLIAFGHLALGISAAAFLALGFLDRMGVLPTWISHPLHEFSPLIRSATGLVIGDIVEKLFGLLSLVAYCYEKIMGSTAGADENEIQYDSNKHTLDLPLLEKILDDEVEFEVNPAHLVAVPLPPAPDCRIEELMTMFDTIDWQDHIETIKGKFRDDERIREIHGPVENQSDKELIQITKTNLQIYIDEVVNEHMAAGEIHDFDRIQVYLKTVTFQLRTEDPLTRADALLRLAVEGGGYCGPEKFHVAEDLYSKLALKCDFIPVESKVLLRLQDSRTTWFMNRYGQMLITQKENECCLGKIVRMVMNFQDLHMYHIFLNLHGKKLGLRKASSENDYAAGVDPLTKAAVKSLTETIQTEFKELYTEKYVAQQLVEGAGTSVLPRGDLFKWWTEWAERQPIDKITKALLKREMDHIRILDTPMQTGEPNAPGPFNARLLKAMALDIGILKIKTPQVA